MPLAPSQLLILAADIAAHSDLASQPNTYDGAFAIAVLYTLDAAPDFIVWKTRLSKKEAVESESVDPDGLTTRTFNWTGAGFITRSQGERDAWRELWNSTLEVNPSLQSVRQAFVDIFSGSTAPAPNNRQHLANVAKRKANRLEKLFAFGLGTLSSPGTMTVEGTIGYQEVYQARNLP